MRSLRRFSHSHFRIQNENENVRKIKTDSDYLEDLTRQLTIIRDRIRGVIHRQATGLYLCGRAGTSKTHTVRTTLEGLEVPYHYNTGHLTPIGLFDLISENRDKIIVLDDVSAIFNQPIALQILLAALARPHSPDHGRVIFYKTAKGTESVTFKGGLIAISNLQLNGHHNEILQALRDRVYAIGFDPTDEQMISLWRHLARGGIRDVSVADCLTVITFLTERIEEASVRPTMRLFDKAIRDFELFAAGRCEAHWKDLILSNLKEEVVTPQEEFTDVSRAEQTDRERRIAAEVELTHDNRKDKITAWEAQTGKSQAAFYRRLGEAKRSGLA